MRDSIGPTGTRSGPVAVLMRGLFRLDHRRVMTRKIAAMSMMTGRSTFAPNARPFQGAALWQ